MRETKKQKLISKEIKENEIYKLPDALELTKKLASKKFDESLDLAIVLGVDAKNQINWFEVL